MSQPVKQILGSGVPVIIGQGMTIKGSMCSKEDVFLDGEIEGDLDVGNCTLTIGPHGKVIANAKAREVDIYGIMTGNVESMEKTYIRTSGQLRGDIRTGGIVIESGAQLKGKVEIVAGPRQKSEAGNEK